MKKTLNKIGDFYITYPLSIDIILSILIVLCNLYFPLIRIKIKENDSMSEYLSNLIGTSVSLSGFILAALTIVVTFKANVSTKELKANPIDYLFTPKNYNKIVSVYKYSIIELVIVFIVLYVLWLNSILFSTIVYYNVLVVSTVLIFTATIRSLSVLFTILNVDSISVK